jgi:kynureninase
MTALPIPTATHVVSRDDALVLDQRDPLRARRDLFTIAEGLIYLDGNSLGALPKCVPERMRTVIEHEWGVGLIRSWNGAGWYTAPERVGATIAQLVGSAGDEITVCDSTSVNLYKVLVAAMRMRPGRSTIVSELGSFPTNAYITTEAAKLMGAKVVFADPAEVETAITDAGSDLAAVQLTEVNFRTAQRYDMATVTKHSHDVGGLTIWDLCHSAGAFSVNLNDCDADFAVGCTYKYLNGGPGSPAFVFVARRHLGQFQQPIPGWHGHAQPFAFAQDFQPSDGISQLLSGTSPQLSLLALESALTAFDGIDMAEVEAKSQSLTELFITLVENRLAGFGFELASPRHASDRGSHVSFAHEQGYAIVQALIARGVVGDFRAPDLLRFGFAPLYVRHVDVFDAVEILVDIMQSEEWKKPDYHVRHAVT